ncbi:MAG TPA: cupredoxin domain-containing protein [Actinomycetota bacterium]|nr:cupredoxin domain-containing protein [Actinomycetota bacterium]
MSIFSVLVLLLAGCGGGGDDEATESQTGTGTEAAGTPTPIAEETIGLTNGEQANAHGEVDASGEDTVEFELDDNYFEPTVILGTAGQEITLEAFNEGGNIHNFSLTDQQIDQDFREDSEEEIEVSFPDSGALTFFCKYHAELGMRGELRVA